ncbi:MULTISPECIES: DUF3135 domain-containing protein [Vibrio]|uniref:DUF3135 domain-containing protein n=2 Tax=Vibrio TaxID=662 RepID=A0A1E5D2E9_9VIBR|nr:DUF3135 domain-containing protein [Vibrio genomosp. F6]OEE77695.1 hypothetical protein A130_14285 [Vibrio genomosp. F6 str. FF-238]
MGFPLTNQTLPPFDDLVALAKNNPQAFKQLKHEMCEEMIQSASDVMQHRLRAQQSHIDLVVSHCKNPNHINITLMKELSVQVVKFQGVLGGEYVLDDDANISPTHSADIIPFTLKEK